VSTKEQVEEGNSLVTQEKNCREYAEKNGYVVEKVFIEMGESAKTADRTELQKLFGFCANRKNNIQTVIAYKIDRISRNTDDYCQIRILLKRYGVEIRSSSEYFENTPAGRFMENIIANVAQFDNDVRAERSIGGMKQAVAEGRYVWKAPLGYSNVRLNNKATISPNEQAPIIKMAFECIARRIMSVEEARLFLKRQGVCNKNGKPISRSHFYCLLRNKLYTGVIQKFGEEYEGKFEPVISKALFEQVQLVWKRKHTDKTYKVENPDFPLRRFVLSPNGRKLTGCWCQGRRKKYPYYRFSGNSKMFPKTKLEELFVFFLNSFRIEENLIEELKRLTKAKLGNVSVIKKAIREQLQRKEQKLKEKQQTLIDKNVHGIIPDFVLKEQLALIHTEMWKVQHELDEQNFKTVDTNYIFSRLGQLLFSPGEYWRKQPFHLKQRLQKFDFPGGIIFDGKNYRTLEICNIFKLGKLFSANNSCKVGSSGRSKKHSKPAKHSPLQKEELMSLLTKVEIELKSLDEILKEKDTEEDNLSPAWLKPAA
jgi:DNA invertase Pin-like site-specific DNA recombinase